MARATTLTSRELTGLSTQLARLETLGPAKRFHAIAQAGPGITAQLGRAREDALIAWIDELMTRRAKPLSRPEAIKYVMDATGLAKSSVANVLIKAERRYGRPKMA